MQTSCLRLMGKKLLVALTMEGKFAGEGLQSIDEDDDMLSAMARELVERNGIGDTADSVWRALSSEHQKLFPTKSRSNDDALPIEMPGVLLDTQPDSARLVEGAIDAASIVVFGQRPQSLSGKRRRGRTAVPEQSSLFGFNRPETIGCRVPSQSSSFLREVHSPEIAAVASNSVVSALPHLSHVHKLCFKSTRRKEVCQKLVCSLAMAAEPLAAKN
jgi:hypothetical protein